jgi:adenylate cyclase
MCQYTSKYAYSDQKEMVRVATVKSVARVLNKIQTLEGQTHLNELYKAIVLLLHDEHPEIRGYLVQSKGMAMFVNQSHFSIDSPSLATGGKIVDVNEQVMAE